MPDLRDPRVEEKGVWASGLGKEPDPLNFPFNCVVTLLWEVWAKCSKRGLFTEQGRKKKSLGVGMRPPCPSISSWLSCAFSRARHLGELFNPARCSRHRAQGLGKCLQAEKTKCVTFKTRKMSKQLKV